MIAFIKPLIVNMTILFSLTFNANLFFPFNDNKPLSIKQKMIYGVISSFAALLCMMYPIESLEDTHFDLRMVIILVVTLYGGYLPGGICLFSVVIARTIIGGSFAPIGILVSILAFIIPLCFQKMFKQSVNRFITATLVIGSYFFVYSIIIYFFVSFLTVPFFFVYYITLILTALFLVYIIEKLIVANQQFTEATYSDKLTTVSQMAASIAHEIRNPITTVRGFIQFLEKDSVDKKLKQFAPLILQELDRTNLIITNYLKLSKPTEYELKRVNLNNLLNDSIELLKPMGAYQNVSLFYNGSGSHYVLADEDRLKQSIINIIKNGIESIDGYGYVKVSKKSTDDNRKVVIEIEDNGKGMSAPQLEKIGLPYYTTKSKGTGLGSMISNRLINEMNGTIEYKSTPNEGTKVIIMLISV